MERFSDMTRFASLTLWGPLMVGGPLWYLGEHPAVRCILSLHIPVLGSWSSEPLEVFSCDRNTWKSQQPSKPQPPWAIWLQTGPLPQVEKHSTPTEFTHTLGYKVRETPLKILVIFHCWTMRKYNNYLFWEIGNDVQYRSLAKLSQGPCNSVSALIPYMPPGHLNSTACLSNGWLL